MRRRHGCAVESLTISRAGSAETISPTVNARHFSMGVHAIRCPRRGSYAK